MINSKDFKILSLLKENAKLSSQQISKKTLIPITTVHNRIKKLEKLGIIKGYSVILDNKKLGKPLAAYVLITADYRLLKRLKMSQQDLIKKIKKSEFVEEAAMITGATDMIIKVRVANINQLNDFVTKDLRNIGGVETTQTLVILNEV